MNILLSFLKDENGAPAIEYGLIAALVSLAGIVGFSIAGASILDSYNSLESDFCAEANC